MMNPRNVLIVIALFYLMTTTIESRPHRIAKSESYESLCKKISNSNVCESIVKSDKREQLKTSAEGITMILTTAAKATMKNTLSYININLKNATNPDVKKTFKNCLLGFSVIAKDLAGVTASKLRDPETRSDVAEKLGEIDNEVTYDCEWFQPDPFQPIIGKMFEMVNHFSDIVTAAQQMVGLI